MSELRDELINLLKISRAEQLRFIASLTDQERSAVGRADAWSPKDVLAHISHWDAVTAEEMPEMGSEQEDEDEEIDHVNAAIWEKYRDASWLEITDLIDKAHNGLVSAIQSLDEAQLTDPELNIRFNRRAMWRTITFGSFYHPLVHLGELYVARGDLAYANKMQEESAELQLAMADIPDWQGAVLYNLGCFYALTGQKEKALKNVRQGLALNDYLKEWAPQDSDLKSLHDDPAFKALLD